MAHAGHGPGRRGGPPGGDRGAAGPDPGRLGGGGDPARLYPPGQAKAIAAGLAEAGWSFFPFIFGVDDVGGRREQPRAALARYTAAMIRHHRQDQVIATRKTDGP